VAKVVVEAVLRRQDRDGYVRVGVVLTALLDLAALQIAVVCLGVLMLVLAFAVALVPVCHRYLRLFQVACHRNFPPVREHRAMFRFPELLDLQTALIKRNPTAMPSACKFFTIDAIPFSPFIMIERDTGSN
jgi:hypothetical protein